eukprot:4009304-Pleurochrysis_carterae.AAC.1
MYLVPRTAQVSAQPRLAFVLPAFDSVRRVSSKSDVRQLWNTSGGPEQFAVHQYPLGHVCDLATKWLFTNDSYEFPYQFGCEPYLLLSRRHLPR